MEYRILNKDISSISNGDAKLLKTLKDNTTVIDIDLYGRGWMRKVMGVHAYIPQIRIELSTYILDKITELSTNIKTKY